MEIEYTDAKEFIPLPKLVSENNKTKELKSLYQREMEYVKFLMPLESFIAYYFYYNAPKLKDVHVVKAIRNIKSNWDKDLDFFKDRFEREMLGVVSLSLQEAKKKITRHELFLVFNYVLWCIDNRRTTGDPQGYLNWIANFFKLLDKNEKKRFNRFYDEYGKRYGKSKEEIKLLKNEDVNIEFSAEEIALAKLDSEKFTENDEDYNDEISEEDSFWEPGGFIKSLGPDDMTEEKMKTFQMGHDEDVNYKCRKCEKRISAHNRDWHEGMCDKCFNKMVYGKDFNEDD